MSVEAEMPGHVTIQTQTEGRDFEVMEAAWNDGRVEVHLRPAGSSDATNGNELRLKLDGTAVTEIIGAVVRFATDADLGVLE
jgi:hypothetical protein